MKGKMIDQKAFLSDIETLYAQNGGNWVDAVIEWCEAYGIEPELAGAIIRKSHSIKAKFKAEAESLHCLKVSDK
jgi:hypothetical protein